MISQPSGLFSGATIVEMKANNRVDTYYGSETNFAFVVENGDVGHDIIKSFGRDDSLITHAKIFDGNKDGMIAFGRNGLLDIDRVSSRKAGNDQLKLEDQNGSIGEIRYLGETSGQYVYASAATLHEFYDKYLFGIEGTVGYDRISFHDDTMGYEGPGALLVDNRLGLNLGHDSISDMREGDSIVTTRKLADADTNGIPEGFSNKRGEAVLDLRAADGTSVGTIQFEVSASHFALVAVGSFEHDNQVFYRYELQALDT